MKTVIINRCHTDNYGDRIIAKCMRELFRIDVRYPCLVDYSFAPFYTKYRLMRKLLLPVAQKIYLKNCSRIVNENDTFIFGGGELLSPGFLKYFLKWNSLIESKTEKYHRFLFAVGFVNSFNEDDIIKLGDVLSHFDGIFLRDQNSYDCFVERLKKCNLSNVHVMPDSVFSLKTPNITHKEGIAFGITSAKRHQKHGVVSFNNDLELYEYYEKILEHLKAQYNEKLIHFIYNTDSDRICMKGFLNYYNQKHNTSLRLANIKKEDDLINIINRSAVVASPRMHACIVACVCNSIVEPILISKKMQSFGEIYSHYNGEFTLLSEKVVNTAKLLMSSIGIP